MESALEMLAARELVRLIEFNIAAPGIISTTMSGNYHRTTSKISDEGPEARMLID